MSGSIEAQNVTTTNLSLPAGFEAAVLKQMEICPIRQAPEYLSKRDTLPLFERQILSAYIEAWVSLKFKAVPDEHPLEYGREHEGILSTIRRNLQREGYLLAPDKVRGLEPSNRAFNLNPIWSKSELKQGLIGLAKQMQPNTSFTHMHVNALSSFLTALSAAQVFGDVTLQDLSKILDWRYEDTVFWGAELKKLKLISAAQKMNNWVITTEFSNKSASPLSVLRVPGSSPELRIPPEKMRQVIPDLIFFLCKATGFSKGLTGGEITKAFLTQGHTSNPGHYLKPLVEQGILLVEDTRPIKGDIELGRLNQVSKLYKIADPEFQPSSDNYDLKDLPAALQSSRATGVFRCKRSGEESTVTTAEVKDLAANMDTKPFSIASLKMKLAAEKIHLTITNLEKLVDTMVEAGMFRKTENLSPKRSVRKNRNFAYDLCDSKEGAEL